MALYKVQAGDSPTLIARAFGVPFDALIRANPHKPTTIVDRVLTWQGILPGETINVPASGTVGAVTPAPIGAPHATIRKGSSGPDVALWQTILGITADGIFGPNTDAATRAYQTRNGLAVDGVVGKNTWAKALSGVAPTPAPAPAPPAPRPPAPLSSLAPSASAALAALSADPNYCTSVGRAGTAVNTAVHNFKSAWNAANPSDPVPIGTGKYEPVVAQALSAALGGATVPPGCGAGAAPPAPPRPPAPPAPPPPGPPPPAPSAAPAVPAAVQALVSIDPCNPANVAVVCAAQRALGLPVDGKYGADTANAAYRLNPNVPKACSPRPSWWAPAGKSNCPGAAPPTTKPPAPPAPPAPKPAPTAAAGAVPAAVQALLAIDPCNQANVAIVVAAQRALGLSAAASDGKYGSDTANAARRVLPGAPAACSPRPAWWAPVGQTNAGSASAGAGASAKSAADTAQTAADTAKKTDDPAKAAAAADQAAAAAAAAKVAADAASADQKAAADAAAAKAAAAADAAKTAAAQTGGGGGLVAPEKKEGLSTGAIVTGAVGAVALVGLIAMAATRKKPGRRRASGGHKRKPTRGKRKPARRKKR